MKKGSLEELYDYFKKFHLSDTLYLFGAINAVLKYGEQKLHSSNVPEHLYRWIGRLTEQERKFVGLNLTRMARFMILSGANDHKGQRMLLDTPAFHKAYEMVIELYDTDVDISIDQGPEAISQYFSRIGQIQFPLQARQHTVIGRGYAMFISNPSIATSAYDFNRKLMEFYKLDCFQFMATGIAMWLLVNGILDYEMTIEISKLKDIVTPEAISIFTELATGTAKQYREMVRGPGRGNQMDKLKDIYGHDPFTAMPAIRVDRSSVLRAGTVVVPQPKYFLEKASAGIFYLLANKEQQIANVAGKTGENPFRNAFGIVFREYIGRHLKTPSKSHTFIDLDVDFSEPWTGLLPDFALINAEVCLLVEVKTTLLKLPARSYFEPEIIKGEVQAGNLKKAVRQLDSFRKAILEKKVKDVRFGKVTRILNIIVGYDQVYVLNSAILPDLTTAHKEISYDLQLASIADIEMMGSGLEQGFNLNELMGKKVADTGAVRWSIATYLQHCHVTSKNQILNEAFLQCMERLGLNK